MEEGGIWSCCGHKLKPDEEILGVEMNFAETDREGDRCIATGGYCSDCAKARKEWETYISNDAEKEAWLEYGILPRELRRLVLLWTASETVKAI
jgi:hypothetical protein